VTPTTFGQRLQAVTAQRGPMCVGIDPHAGLLEAWGLPDSVDGLKAFCEAAVTAFAGEIAVLKPQSAFFERFGAGGIAVLEQLIPALRSAGALVLLDAKRGDIGSTAQAYADAYLRPDAPLAVDAMTAHAYLGFDALAPLIDTAHAHGTGVFVVGISSNPEGAAVQQARGPDGTTVGAAILRSVAAANAMGPSPGAGSIGAVVGATLTRAEIGTDPDIGGPLLAPGIGAQGGTAAGLRALFGDALPRVLPSASREVLRVGPDPAALKTAALRIRDQVVALLG
jgi:orotidine-5'-phosphate decarboxylase